MVYHLRVSRGKRDKSDIDKIGKLVDIAEPIDS